VDPVAKDDQRPEHDGKAIGFIEGVMVARIRTCRAARRASSSAREGDVEQQARRRGQDHRGGVMPFPATQCRNDQRSTRACSTRSTITRSPRSWPLPPTSRYLQTLRILQDLKEKGSSSSSARIAGEKR
jgi:hypothetical protein